MISKALMSKPKKSLANSLVNSRRKFQVVAKDLAVYAPSIGGTVVTVGGGAIAGAVNSGKTPIPDEIAGLSTPLLLGGILASYGIFSSKNSSNPMLSKAAVNLGNGMIAVWASEYVGDMIDKQQGES